MKFEVPVYIYDFEVFCEDWICTFKNFETGELFTFENDRDGFIEFYKNHIEHQAILVGYNNKWYDDHMIKGVLVGVNLWDLNDHIIVKKLNPWQYEPFCFKKFNIISFDIMGEMAIGNPISLKQLQGYFGWRIFECPISFRIDRKLTQEELQIVREYNIYDVESTAQIFSRFGAKMKSHMALLDFFDMDPTKLNISSSSKAAKALNAQKIDDYHFFKYETPKLLKQKLLEFQQEDVINTFENELFYTDRAKQRDKNFSFQKDLQDFKFNFALGGGHGAIENFEYEGEIWNLDVKSYYVSLMINFDFVSRGLGVNGKAKIKEILDWRIEQKNKGNIDLSDGFKMVLVALYGSMAFESSLMWDPQKQLSVCITGQLLLYLLCLMLQQYATIIQINTDGIMIIPKCINSCTRLYKEWESWFNLELELEIGKKIVQKDVNNYIFLKDHINDLNNKLEIQKKIKTKGSGVRFFNIRMQDNEFGQLANFTINNNYTIVDEAVVKYFLFNTPIEDTIKNCKDLIRFQFVLKLMGNFKKLVYKVDDKYYDIKETGLKCYRLFAVKQGGFEYYKCKDVDGNLSYNKISKSSNNMLILNDDLNNYDFDQINIDFDHYIEMANKIVRLYKNTEQIEDIF